MTELNTGEALIAYLKSHPNMRLEWNQGTAGRSWYWVREDAKSNTVAVHGNAAQAAIRNGDVVCEDRQWNKSRYRLVIRPEESK